MSREVLAVRAGLSVSTLTRLELHDRLPNVRALSAIAEVLEIDPAQLLPATTSSN